MTRDERIIEVIVNGQRANASLKEMEGATRALSSQLKTLTPGTAEFVEKSRQLTEVRARYNEVKASINQVAEANGFLKDTMATAFGSVLGGGVQGAIGKVFELGQSIFDTSAKFEKYEAIMTNALGSGSQAQKALADIQKMAAATPFSVDELTGSFIKFVNRGLQPSMAEMTNMADLAASQGKSFDQLTEAVLDAAGGEFERLKEFGVKASKSGDQVTLSFKNQQKVIANTPEAINAAILSFGAMEGVVGSCAVVSETMEGQLSNLGDTADQVKIAFGQGLRPVFVAILSTLGFFLGILKELPGFVKENRGALLALAGAVLTFNAPLIQSNALLLYNAALSKGKVVWDRAVALSTTAWEVAQRGLNLALGANPIGAVVAVTMLLVGAFVALYDKSEKVRATVAGLGAVFKQVFANVAKAASEALGGLGELLDGVFSRDLGKIRSGGSKLLASFKSLGDGAGDAFNKGYDDRLASEHAARDQREVEAVKKREEKKKEAVAKARLEALKNEEAAIRARLAKVAEGTEQELRLKQRLVTNEAAQKLLDEKKSEADRRIILAEAQQQRDKLEDDYRKKNQAALKKHQAEVEKARKEFHTAMLKADGEFEKMQVEAMAEGLDKELAKLKLARDQELRELEEKKKAVLANTAATEADKQHVLEQYRQTATMAEARYQQGMTEARKKQAEKDEAERKKVRDEKLAQLDAEGEEQVIVLDNAWLEQKLHLKKQTVDYMQAEQARADAELKLRRKVAAAKLALLKAEGKGETVEAKKLANTILKIDGEIADGKADSDKRITEMQKKEARDRQVFEQDLAASKVQLGAEVLDAVIGHLDKESAAYQVATAFRKTLALAEIGINLQKELSANAAAAAADPLNLVPGGAALVQSQLAVKNAIAIVRAGVSAVTVAGFARGGYTGAGQGPADGTGYRVAGVVHEGEWVAPKWMLQQPKYANVIGYLEAERRGYAQGGLASLPPSAAEGGSQASGDQTAALLQQLIGVVHQQNQRMNQWQERLGVDYHASNAQAALDLRTDLKKGASLVRSK